jgi:CheY-like chemotaxis protein
MTNCHLRCVIVDDNADFLAAATTLLEQDGFTVVGTARSVSDGLQSVELLQPDVALVDVNLGEESGLDLVDQLHRGACNAGVTAILISTFAERQCVDLIAADSTVKFLPKLELSGDAIRNMIVLARSSAED